MRPVRLSWRLRTQAGTGVLGAKLAADGSGYGLIQIAAGGSRRPFAADVPIEDTQMTIPDGQAVFARAVELMVASSREALGKAQLSVADIDCLIPHQANGRIIAAVAQQLGVSPEKVVSSIAEFGNSSAATIPLSLSLAAGEGRMARGQRLLMCAAGAGLTGGAVSLLALSEASQWPLKPRARVQLQFIREMVECDHGARMRIET